METFLSDILLALWLGILTSISPCPLATNIAAISFVGKDVSKKSSVILAGVFYTLGRMILYMALAFVLIKSFHAAPSVSFFLQQYMSIILGPLLVVIGVILLEIIPMPTFGGSGFGLVEKIKEFAAKKKFLGIFILGFIFALSFCPVSAALFFGSVFPVIFSRESTMLIPAVYGIGTALPVIVFAFILAFAANKIGMVFNAITVFEKWARKITAIIFIVAGIFLIFKYLAI